MNHETKLYFKQQWSEFKRFSKFSSSDWNFIMIFVIFGIFSGIAFNYSNTRTYNKRLITEISSKTNSVDSLQQRINSLQVQYFNFYMDRVTFAHVTTYNPVEEQCDDTPNITADGSKFDINKASQYRWIALDQSLIARYDRGGKFNYGDIVYLHGNRYPDLDGFYIVKDTMNKRYGYHPDCEHCNNVGSCPNPDHINRADILVNVGEEKPFQSRNVAIYRINLVDHGLTGVDIDLLNDTGFLNNTL